MIENKQTTDTVLMVYPIHFRFNRETSGDNHFQTDIEMDHKFVLDRVHQEFSGMVDTLTMSGIQVLVMYPKDDLETPDEIFPNNWFSTHYNGTLYLYPMMAKCRQQERRIPQLVSLLISHKFKINKMVDFANDDHYLGQYLEGTGVLVLDHINRIGFAGLSDRCNQRMVNLFSYVSGYKIYTFNTQHPTTQKPIFHTNMLLSIGQKFTVVCLDVIQTKKDIILNILKSIRRDIITITPQQMDNFCGNILQLHNNKENIIVMTKTAYQNYTIEQLTQLSNHGLILPIQIDTIEKVGGGGIRCMLAEIFL